VWHNHLDMMRIDGGPVKREVSWKSVAAAKFGSFQLTGNSWVAATRSLWGGALLIEHTAQSLRVCAKEPIGRLLLLYRRLVADIVHLVFLFPFGGSTEQDCRLFFQIVVEGFARLRIDRQTAFFAEVSLTSTGHFHIFFYDN
jgi:hypothetical protein